MELWGDTGADSEGLMGAKPFPQKKLNFSLEMVCFGAFWAVFFVCVLAKKTLNFNLK